MSAQKIQLEDKGIKIVKNWPKPKSLYNIKVLLGFANFYQCFIYGFSKIGGLLTLMLKTTSLTCSSTILQSLINTRDDDEVDRGKNDGNGINLLNLSTSKISNRASYSTFENAKRGSSNIKKGVKVVRGSNYLTPGVKKVFNLL